MSRIARIFSKSRDRVKMVLRKIIMSIIVIVSRKTHDRIVRDMEIRECLSEATRQSRTRSPGQFHDITIESKKLLRKLDKIAKK